MAALDQTIPDQKGKPTQKPTLRRIAQMFEGVDILIIRQGGQIADYLPDPPFKIVIYLEFKVRNVGYMSDVIQKQKNTWPLQLALALMKQPVLAAEAWKVMRKIGWGLADEGLYEVLEYETQLELTDTQGQTAEFRKRQKVQYRQNNIIAYQDQAWGDGDILINYQCSPGQAVDYYRPDQKTFILIALHDVKHKGDVDEFHIKWGILGGFTRSLEQWGTEISHKTRQLKIQIIFPKMRPPIHAWVVEQRTQRKYEHPQQLADGRWLIQWETLKPHLHEQYILKWDW